MLTKGRNLLCLLTVFALLAALCGAASAESERRPIQIRETVLLEGEGVSVTATQGSISDNGSEEIDFRIENNRSERIRCRLTSMTINGVGIDAYMDAKVGTNSRGRDSIFFDSEYLSFLGGEIRDLRVSLAVYNDKTDELLCSCENVEIPVLDSGERDFAGWSVGLPLLDDPRIRVELLSVLPKDNLVKIYLLVHNDSDWDLHLSSDSAVVNGQEAFSIAAGSIDPHSDLLIDFLIMEAPAPQILRFDLSFYSHALGFHTVARADTIYLAFDGDGALADAFGSMTMLE